MELSNYTLVSKTVLNREDGTTQKFHLLDRPQLYIEKGKSKVLLCAVKMSENETFNVAIPLNEKNI